MGFKKGQVKYLKYERFRGQIQNCSQLRTLMQIKKNSSLKKQVSSDDLTPNPAFSALLFTACSDPSPWENHRPAGLVGRLAAKRRLESKGGAESLRAGSQDGWRSHGHSPVVPVQPAQGPAPPDRPV